MLMYCEKVYKRSGKNLFRFIENSGEVLDKLKARAFNATSLSKCDFYLRFTLLYLIIKLEIHSLILLKEPSKEKALLNLHVTTETRFSLQNSLKNIMNGLVKMYVML